MKSTRPKLSKEQRKARKKHRDKMNAEIAAIAPVVTPAPTSHMNGTKGRVERPYVARTTQGNTSIVLFRARSKVYHVPMESEGLRVFRTPMDTFDYRFKPWEYPIQKAAQSYLNWSQQYLGITDVARDALTAITKGDVDMSSIETATGAQGEPTKKVAATKSAAKAARKPSKVIVKSAEPKAAKKAAKTAAPKNGKKTAAPVKKNGKTAEKEKATRSSINPDLKIRKLHKDNPRREGTHLAMRYDSYREGMTVAKALENPTTIKSSGGVKYKLNTPASINKDVIDGMIKLVK